MVSGTVQVSEVHLNEHPLASFFTLMQNMSNVSSSPWANLAKLEVCQGGISGQLKTLLKFGPHVLKCHLGSLRITCYVLIELLEVAMRESPQENFPHVLFDPRFNGVISCYCLWGIAIQRIVRIFKFFNKILESFPGAISVLIGVKLMNLLAVHDVKGRRSLPSLPI